jgi:hypothetical protein
MSALFVILLIVLLFFFFGPVVETRAANPTGTWEFFNLISIPMDQGVRFFLGFAIIFCEFAIILFAMLDRIGDTIKEIIKPMVRLLPLGAFMTTIYHTFSPLAFSLLPPWVAEMFGEPRMSVNSAMESSINNTSILLTIATMFLFLLATKALSEPRETAEVKALKAQIARYKKELRRGL